MTKSRRKTGNAQGTSSPTPLPSEPKTSRKSKVLNLDISAAMVFQPVDETTIRRPFAATLDLQEMVWQFLGPVAGIAAATLFPCGPEAQIRNAIQAIVERVVKNLRFTPEQLARAGLRFLHLSGQASASELGQQLIELLVRSYLESVKTANPGQAVEVRPSEGSRLELHFGTTADPSLPPAADTGPLSTLPPAALPTIWKLRGTLAPYHVPVVGLVQQLLESFTGKHAATLTENKAVATAVNDLAEDYGVALVYQGEPVTLRVVPVRRDPSGSFQARRIGSDQKILKTSMAFPPLTAVSKANLAAAMESRESDATDDEEQG